MTERKRILDEMEDGINQAFLEAHVDDYYTDWAVRTLATIAAEVALEVIERPPDSSKEDYSKGCNCGQSGYPENSPHSNHPHYKSCPEYSGKYPDIGDTSIGEFTIT